MNSLFPTRLVVMRYRVQVNDTIKLDLETGKPIDTIKFEIGNVCMIARGRNAGRAHRCTRAGRNPENAGGLGWRHFP